MAITRFHTCLRTGLVGTEVAGMDREGVHEFVHSLVDEIFDNIEAVEADEDGQEDLITSLFTGAA